MVTEFKVAAVHTAATFRKQTDRRKQGSSCQTGRPTLMIRFFPQSSPLKVPAPSPIAPPIGAKC